MQAASTKPAYVNSAVMAIDPMVAVMKKVVTDNEIDYLIKTAKEKVQRSKVSADTESITTDHRTGSNCWLYYEKDPIAKKIGERIAKIVGIPLSHAEAIQIVHYAPGQEYRPHHDAYNLDTPRGQRCCAKGGQRLVTALVYLNEVEEGGGTSFPKLNITINPTPGRLLLFHNTGEDVTKAHPDSLHAGTPVIKGEKWAFTIWFHQYPMSYNPFKMPQNEVETIVTT